MSTSLFDPDDPRLTAYALGESSDAEREAVEQLLVASPEARAAVEQTRTFARRLEEEFTHENAAYQEAHPQAVVATNVIAFPTARRRWRPAVALGWKIAAVFIALGSVVLLTVRRTPPATVATVQPSAMREITVPPPTKEMPPEPSTSPEVFADNDKILSATDEESRAGAAKPDAPRPSLETDRAATASLRRDGSADSLPGAAPAAAPKALTSPSPDERLAPAIVRVRLGDGTFVGGVLLTGDGQVLVARMPSTDEKPATIILADGREFRGTAPGIEPIISMGRLRIEATGLPHVSLALDAPADGNQLVVAHFDEHSGTPSFVHVQASKTGGSAHIGAEDGGLVFNAAGELLATERTPGQAKAAARTRSALRRDAAGALLVRPFTAAERALLIPKTK